MHRTPFTGMGIVGLLFAIGCSGSGGLGSLVGPVGLDSKTRALFDNAIQTLDRQSSAWQATLVQLEHDLAGQAQSLVQQVDDLLQRGIASAGGEIRCDIDFIGVRMKQGLKQIVASFGGPAVSPLPPSICHAVPDHVDRRVDPSQLTIVAFYGYDLDNMVRVALVNRDGSEVDVSQYKALVSPYQLTINVSPNGVPFTAMSQKLSLRFNGQVIQGGEVAIEQNLAVPLQVVTATSAPANRSRARAAAGPNQVLVGGGCSTPGGGTKQFLAAGWPDTSGGFNCEAAGGTVRLSGTVTAYAIVVDASAQLDVRVFAGPQSGHGITPAATASVGAGYTLVSGGCRITNDLTPPNDDWGGIFLQTSAPLNDQVWSCAAKQPPNKPAISGTIQAFAIGVRSDRVTVSLLSQQSSPPAGDEQVSLSSRDGVFFGGGCNINDWFQMPYGSYPTGTTSWTCQAQNLNAFGSGTVTASALKVTLH